MPNNFNLRPKKNVNGVKEHIFEENADILNIIELENQAIKKLAPLEEGEVIIYVNGSITEALAVVNVCYRYDIKITFMHYDSSDNKYVGQRVL